MGSLERLTQALRCLPGIGPKSAQRMVYHLLQRKRSAGLTLAACLEDAMRTVVHCQRCNNYTDLSLCAFCQDTTRDTKTLCVVEQPGDVEAIEQSGAYKGGYFVLMGKISPLDGITPEDIALAQLQKRVFSEEITEVILALTPSVEGQITAHFIASLFENKPIKLSQLAQGIPSGGTLDYLDEVTIGSALRHRRQL